MLSDLFRVAAEAESDAILKLYSSEGHLMNISHRLAANTSHTRYELNVVGAYNYCMCNTMCTFLIHMA